MQQNTNQIIKTEIREIEITESDIKKQSLRYRKFNFPCNVLAAFLFFYNGKCFMDDLTPFIKTAVDPVTIFGRDNLIFS